MNKFNLLLIACTVSLLTSPISQASLIAYYSFDDGTATDLSGNANHGSVGSSLAFSADQPGALAAGQSVVGDGTGNATGIITVPTSASLETLVHQITISLWLKADAASNSDWVRYMRKGNEANGQGTWLLNRNAGTDESNIRIDTYGAGGQFNQNRGVNDDSNVFNNTWRHLAYTLDNGLWEEWVDGSLVDSGTYIHGASGFSNTEPLLLVGRGNPNLVGSMDEVAIWSNKLDSNAITHLSNGGSALTIPEPSSAWMLILGGALLFRRHKK